MGFIVGEESLRIPSSKRVSWSDIVAISFHIICTRCVRLDCSVAILTVMKLALSRGGKHFCILGSPASQRHPIVYQELIVLPQQHLAHALLLCAPRRHGQVISSHAQLLS